MTETIEATGLFVPLCDSGAIAYNNSNVVSSYCNIFYMSFIFMYFIYFCQNIIYIGSDMLNSMFDLTPRQRRSSIVSNRNVLYSRFAV
jgi:hypothetical protein